jgi:adenylate kinase
VEYKRPTVELICDKCGDTLVQRKDDQPETVHERLNVYHEQTEPLKSYYAEKNKLFMVEGQEEVADTTRLTLAALEA